MPVVATKSEQRCKLCRHDARTQIDELLEMRSLRKKDADGQLVNLQYVLSKLAALGVENPTEDNIKIHWRKHCEQVSEAKLAEVNSVREDLLAKIEAGELELIDLDEATRKLATLAYYEILDRAKRGEKTGLTVDHFIKLGDLQTKRRHNEKTEQLLGGLAGGIALALGGGSRGELPSGEAGELIEDGEFEDAGA